MTTHREIRVLVADDHPMFCYGLRSVLASNPTTILVSEAATGDEAVTLAAVHCPDVVIMDLTMPGLNGVEVTKQILTANAKTRVLVVSMFDDSASVLAAIRAGASGYLVKGADRDELLRAIATVAEGGIVFSSPAATHLTRHLATPLNATATIPGLTSREHEILGLMAEGWTNTAISEQLGLSGKTVRNYVSIILGKLGDVDRRGAIERARASGMSRHNK